VAGYVGSGRTSRIRSFLTSVSFVLGLSLTLGAFGAFAGVAGRMLVNTEALNYSIAIVLLLMGLWQLGILQFNGFALPLRRSPAKAGYAQAFMLGVPFAISASPCTAPITMGLLAFSSSRHSGLLGMSIMVVFALGRSLPLLLIGVFAGFLKTLKTVSQYQPLVEKAAGVLLVGLGLYFFWKA
jgi:cytochrome c-type biogenesis protein